MNIQLKHSISGSLQKAKLGFSWTALFFGLFVPLLRGDFKWSVLSLALSIITAGLFWLVFPFIYNKKYIKTLLEKGFIPANDESKRALQNKGLIA